MADLTVGADVLGADGAKLGLLKEVHGTYLHVENPASSTDFWLAASDVREASADKITVSFPSVILGVKKIPPTTLHL